MRIAYLANSTIPSREANAVHVVNMAAALSALDHMVELWVYPGGHPNVASMTYDQIAAEYGISSKFRVRYIREPNLPGRSTFGAVKVAWTLMRQRPELLIGRHAKACAISALLGLRVLFETHQPISWFPMVDRLFLKIAIRLRRFAGIVTISDPLLSILKHEIRTPGTRLLAIHDGASIIDSSPAHLGGEGRLQIGYVGHLYRGRGIEIIEMLARRLPQADFHLIGGNPDEVRSWRKRLTGLSNVELHGFVSPAKAASMRLGCDILLAPYQLDTSVPGGRETSKWMSPLKIFEYMASAVPIVASDLPVLREVLRPGVNALMVAPDDVDGWEAAIRLLMNDPELRTRLGTAARHDLEEKYTWRARAAKLVAFGSASDVDRHTVPARGGYADGD